MTEGTSAAAERSTTPLGRKLLFALTVPLVLFLLGECALRVKSRIRSGTWDHRYYFRNRGHDLFERHFHLGNVPIAGAEYADGSVRASINTLGFRGRELAVPKPAGTFRIAVLGGSAVFGTRNSSDEATWPAQLEERLHERLPDRAIEVVNAGCSGYDSLASLINLQCRVLELEPDLILVYNAFNDLKINRLGEFRSDHSNYDRLSKDDRKSLADHSILLLTLRHHVGRMRRRSDPEGRKTWDDVGEAGTRAFRRNLESIAAICRQHGVGLALSTFARPWTKEIPEALREGWVMQRFTPAGLDRAYEVYNETIREVAEAQGVTLVDAARLVPPHRSLFADAVHFNDEGAATMAGLVAPVLVPLIR